MTTEELQQIIQVFRIQVEDLVSAINRRFYLDDGSVYPDDGRIEVVGQAWANIAQVLATIPESLRTPYLTVNVSGTEYWFLPGDLTTLVPKVGNLALVDGSVTLIKMANVPSGTVFYRVSAGDGPPEVQTLEKLREDLNIPVIDISGKVDKIENYSLVHNDLIAKIHSPGSDNQDLSGYVQKIEGCSLISDLELERLAAIKQAVYKIELPAGASIAERLAGITVIPAAWTVEVDGDTGENLIVTHNLDSRIAHINIKATDLTGTRILVPFRDAYSGILENDNVITIESLADNNLPIIIELIFD